MITAQRRLSSPRRDQDFESHIYEVLLENIRRTVQEYIKSCQTRQKIKARNHKPYRLLQQMESPKGK